MFFIFITVKVVRISDKDVLRNIEGVWSFVTELIKDRVEELEEKSPPALRAPSRGENPPVRLRLPPLKREEMRNAGQRTGPIPKGWRGETGRFIVV